MWIDMELPSQVEALVAQQLKGETTHAHSDTQEHIGAHPELEPPPEQAQTKEATIDLTKQGSDGNVVDDPKDDEYASSTPDETVIPPPRH